MKLGLRITLLSTIVMAGVSAADELELSIAPLEVSTGNLLFFFRPEPYKGPDRKEVLYAFDPISHQEPQKIWEGNAPLLGPIVRLDQNRVLFERLNQHQVVDLKTGEVTQLLDGKNQTKFIDCRDGIVRFLKRSIPYKARGYKLKRSEKDPSKTVMDEYFRPRNFLYQFAKKAEQLNELAIEQVLAHKGEFLWVISAGDEQHNNRKLCKISLDGSVEEVIKIDDHWVAPEVDFLPSPNGKLIALSALHDQHDVHEERELVVIDVGKKRVLFAKERIKDLFPSYGNLAFLNVSWESDSSLSYGLLQTKRIDLSQAKIQETEMPRTFTAAAELTSKKLKWFDHEHGLLFFKGENKPVVDVLDANDRNVQVRDLAIAPSGQWAAYLSAKPNALCLVDGKQKTTSRLLEGWCYGLKWLE